MNRSGDAALRRGCRRRQRRHSATAARPRGRCTPAGRRRALLCSADAPYRRRRAVRCPVNDADGRPTATASSPPSRRRSRPPTPMASSPPSRRRPRPPTANSPPFRRRRPPTALSAVLVILLGDGGAPTWCMRRGSATSWMTRAPPMWTTPPSARTRRYLDYVHSGKQGGYVLLDNDDG